MYEFTFLLNEEEEIKNIRKLFESLKGKITSEEAWGKKTLAYPIKKNTAAYYYNWKFDMNSEDVEELKRKLNFSDKIMRYLILKA